MWQISFWPWNSKSKLQLLKANRSKIFEKITRKKAQLEVLFHWNLRDHQYELNPSVDGLEIYIQPLAVI